MNERESRAGAPGWIGALLTRSWSSGEATIVQQLLQSYGIPCQLVSDVPHSILPMSVDGLCEIRIMVSPSRLREARDVLAEHRRHGYRVVRGGRSGRTPAGRPEDLEGQGGAGA